MTDLNFNRMTIRDGQVYDECLAYIAAQGAVEVCA